MFEERLQRQFAERELEKTRHEARQGLFVVGLVVALGFAVWLVNDENWEIARACFFFAMVLAIGTVWGIAFGPPRGRT